MAAEQETKLSLQQSLNDLQYRLQRLEFFLLDPSLTASDAASRNVKAQAQAGKKQATVGTRLVRLEEQLQSLTSRSTAVRDLLHFQSSHPSLFPGSSHSPSVDESSEDNVKNHLTQILASAPLYPSTSSQLLTLQDLASSSTSSTSTSAFPPAKLCADLIALRPRLAQAEARQDTQRQEFAKLRARSAQAVQAWYEVGVLGAGEAVGDWDARCRAAEKRVRQREREQIDEQERIM